jgi:hypothetical protein
VQDESTDDTVEVGESIEITDLVDQDGNIAGTIVDDVVVITDGAGSLVDETIGVFDADGNLVSEEEIIDVYDADAHLLAETDAKIVVLDD